MNGIEQTPKRSPWVDEIPKILTVDNLQLTYFREQEILRIGFLFFDSARGYERVGRRISLRKDRIAPEAVMFLKSVFDQWADELEGVTS